MKKMLLLLILLPCWLVQGCSKSGPACDPEQGSEWYQCPDGSRVPWCECTATGWQCDPEPQKQCQNVPSCETDGDCNPQSYCDPCASGSCPTCDDCVAGCLLHGCQTESVAACLTERPDCGSEAVAVIRDGCWVCVELSTCRPPRDTSCDDGGELLCAIPEPECQEWEILSLQEGCWLCVNRDTCRPWAEAGCETDMQCTPERRCDPCARGSCPDCKDCVADCVPHGCPTEPQATCRMPRTECPQGQVAVVSSGCWVCVELSTCLPPRDTSCDDGTEVTCDMVPPVCRGDSILAAKNSCWECVNPLSCVPWGEPGCKDDASCKPEQFCDPCGTPSCATCGDCLPACRPHGCPSEEELLCFCARPNCGKDAVSVIKDGCWICVWRKDCQPTGDGC